jgi:DNA-binding beta-propeller fold protein YncE
VDSNGNITTFAGGGTGNPATDGILATTAILNAPRCVALDNLGNLYIADTGNNAVRKVDANRIITTVAGQWVQSPIPADNNKWVGVIGPTFLAINHTGFIRISTNEPGGDGGPATSAYLNGPQGIAVDPQGTSLYIADTGNQAIREVYLNTGIITLVAGGYTDGGSDGAPASLTVPAGSIGPGELTRLNTPSAVAADAAGNVFIADSLNYRALRVDEDGNVYVISGQGATWGDNKAATAVSLIMPRGVAVDNNGNVYVTEALGIVRKLTPQAK